MTWRGCNCLCDYLPEGSSLHHDVPPLLQGLDLSQGVPKSVTHWEMVRLLAPRAEVRLQVVGHVPVIEASRLGWVGTERAGMLVSVNEVVLEKKSSQHAFITLWCPYYCAAP